MKRILMGTIAIALLQSALWAADEKSELTDQKEKVSYIIGTTFGNNLKRGGYDVNVDTLAGAIRDAFAGKEPKFTEAQSREVMLSYTKEMAAKREAERQQKAEKNRKEGDEFLAENKKKEGVKTHTVTLPGKSGQVKTAELQYKVLQEGKGPTPKSNDVVTVNYRGTLINGTEFDSSVKNGSAPIKKPVTDFIKGWIEALQMMKVGSKWQLFIPSSLAYEDQDRGQGIAPGSTLIFEVELLSTESVASAPPTQPLTSDIIKVPSAEGLKKGEKIEVIKPEDVSKKIKESQEQKK